MSFAVLGMRRQVFELLETVSRTLAPTKAEMDVFLGNGEHLSTRDGAGGPGYVEELRYARQLLSKCPDLPTFFHELADHAGGATASPAQVAAEIKRERWTVLVAGWVLLLAFMLSVVSGYLRLDQPTSITPGATAQAHVRS